MEWLIAIIALLVGLISGWWLASRACQQRHEQEVAADAPEPATASAALTDSLSVLEDDPDPDDLQKIEGIGPKIAERLNMGGIYTFAELAGTPVERIKDILVGGGSRFRVHDPGTWPQQAQLAADGEWDELRLLQDELDAGRRA